MGGLAVGEGQSDRARELYQQSLDIRDRLAETEPGNTTYQRDLAVAAELGNAETEPRQRRAVTSRPACERTSIV
ncbi:hypothetical protein EV644_12696 [Kribbella orskensis]|uniref:Tetratricopeptide repeat protein n=1 Tax=Kribbella orskensis TaxID=2512216 RepID=A0ABY2B9B5_9ACTN|nr:hypothetical protein EV642_1294 [Kribbella sp. VKM Ac-2500]TCO12352.1 hypothetical protein EV644_12696 [Kribbella orskensis]